MPSFRLSCLSPACPCPPAGGGRQGRQVEKGGGKVWIDNGQKVADQTPSGQPS